MVVDDEPRVHLVRALPVLGQAPGVVVLAAESVVLLLEREERVEDLDTAQGQRETDVGDQLGGDGVQGLNLGRSDAVQGRHGHLGQEDDHGEVVLELCGPEGGTRLLPSSIEKN